MSSRKRQLKRAIDRFESEVVNPLLNDILISFLINASYLVAVIGLIVVANLAPTALTTLVGSVGLGSLSIASNYERLQKASAQFLKDRRNLRAGVTDLRFRLSLCEENDAKCLARVQDVLVESYERVIEQNR